MLSNVNNWLEEVFSFVFVKKSAVFMLLVARKSLVKLMNFCLMGSNFSNGRHLSRIQFPTGVFASRGQ
jgi:hypothetical protein